MEGYATDPNSYVSPAGVSTNGYATPPPYMFPQMIVRENIIRHRDNQFSAPDASIALRLTSVENALIEGNTVELTDPHLFQYAFGKNVKTFGNKTPSGQVLHPFEDIGGSGILKVRDDLEGFIEDVTFLAL